MADTPQPSAVQPADILRVAKISADVTSLIHGGKFADAADLLKNLALDVAEIAAIVPGGQPIAAIAGTVGEVAAVVEPVVAAAQPAA